MTQDSISVKHTATLLAVTDRRVRQLVEEAQLARSEEGFITVESLAQHMARQRVKLEAEVAKADVGDYEMDKARKMKAEADMAEIDAAKAAGKVLDAKAMQKTLEAAIEIVMVKLGTIGANIGPRAVIAEDAKAATLLIDEAIVAACQGLYDLDIEAALAEREAAANAA